MRTQIAYNEPSFHGYDWQSPLHVKRAIQSVVSSVAEAVTEIGGQLNDVRYQTASGQTLEQAVKEGRWRRGEVRWFHLTWSEAMQIQNEARALICDGRNGTPQIVSNPNISGSLSRFIKGVAYGSNSGTTDGSALHTHILSGEVSVCAHDLSHTHESAFTVSSDTHYHTVMGSSGTPSSLVSVAGGSDIQVASCSHTHTLPCTCPDTHNHTLSGTTSEAFGEVIAHSVSDNLSVNATTTDPPHVTLIPLMKL